MAKKLTPQIGTDYIGVSVSFFCHDGRGNFVLHKRSNNCRDEQGTWDVGGGKLEFGEGLIDGVLRELKEEYGCSGKIEEQLPALSVIRKHNRKKTHWVSNGFIIRVNPQDVIIAEPQAMTEIGWFTLDNLPKPLHSGMTFRLSKQMDLFKKYMTKA